MLGLPLLVKDANGFQLDISSQNKNPCDIKKDVFPRHSLMPRSVGETSVRL